MSTSASGSLAQKITWCIVNLNKPCVLVTGGAGYIGSHTCKALSQAGFTPIAYDNLVYGHREAVKWGPLIHGDIGNCSLVKETLQNYQPAAIIHFAAFTYVGESVSLPGKYYRNNVSGSLAFLEALCTYKPLPFIFSSTCATYGMPQSIPIDEEHPQAPMSPYGRTKLMIEQILCDFSAAHALPHVALRYFNASGADPRAEIGEDHDPETHLIPLVIEAALGKRSYIEIYGTDYPTHDGTAIRDYIHVTDLAYAHVKALQHLLSGGENLQLNLGTGQGYSVRQIIKAVEEAAGTSITIREQARRAGDPPVLVANSSKSQKLLKWQLQHSDLETIVATALKWHRKKWATQ